MYPAVEESQRRKEYSLYLRRLAPQRAMPEGTEEKEESRAARGEEDDLRIMQHFARNLIERSQDT